VLRHADSQRARLEEPLDESRLGSLCLDRSLARFFAHCLVHQLADAVGDYRRVMGMAAVREPHSADGVAIARRRAEGGRLARRGRPDLLFRLYRAAAYRA